MSHDHHDGNRFVYALQEYSIPLLLGVVVALVMANTMPDTYHTIVYDTLSLFTAGDHTVEAAHDATSAVADGAQADHDGHHGLHHYLSLHFLVNDLFMVLFFGIAAKEIAEACLPGGALNPMSKAINPLLGTLGGVLGPVGCYFLLNGAMGQDEWARGWGIPTATDIALAWLIARTVSYTHLTLPTICSV